jgi:pyruvate dehydrogenase E1 component alpha subunit
MACDLMDPQVERALDDEAEELAARLRADAKALPDPAPITMFDHVYAEPHPLIDAERSALAAYWSAEA